MKAIATFLAAAAATLVSASAFAADSSDRTSMPTNCSDRNANCVIQDGPPRGRQGVDPSATTRPSGPPGNTAGNPSSKSGDSKSGNNPSTSR